MLILSTVRTLILAIGWPVLIIGSIYFFTKGSRSDAYKMIKGSLVGKITKALAISLAVEMFSLGAITTAYLYSGPLTQVLLVAAPVFVIWVAMFAWTMGIFVAATKQVHAMAQPKAPETTEPAAAQ